MAQMLKNKGLGKYMASFKADGIESMCDLAMLNEQEFEQEIARKYRMTLVEKRKIQQAMKQHNKDSVDQMQISWSPTTLSTLKKTKDAKRISQLGLIQEAFQKGKITEALHKVKMESYKVMKGERWEQFVRLNEKTKGAEVGEFLRVAEVTVAAQQAKVAVIPVVDGQEFTMHLIGVMEEHGFYNIKMAHVEKSLTVKVLENKKGWMAWVASAFVGDAEAERRKELVKALNDNVVMEAFIVDQFSSMLLANRIKVISA